MLASAHEYRPTDTTTTLLQSVQKGRHMNGLDNYFIQLFKHNNMIVNEQTLQERSYYMICDLQQCHACA